MAKTFGELGLRPREMRVIKACLYARTLVPNGHYLCALHEVASAKRLIARGFVTDVTSEAGLAPRLPGWIVVKIDEANIEAMQKA